MLFDQVFIAFLLEIAANSAVTIVATDEVLLTLPETFSIQKQYPVTDLLQRIDQDSNYHAMNGRTDHRP